MSIHKKIAVSLALLLCVAGNTFSQVITKTEVLKAASIDQAGKEKVLHEKLLRLSKEKGWPLIIHGKKGNIAMLAGVDPLGYPMYLSTENNIAAITIRTNSLWAGGSSGLNLSGSSNSVKGKLALWDGGKVRLTHVELSGRITQKDNPPDPLPSDHSTHVAGTLMASGVNPIAKGMAYGLQELLAYDFDNQFSEMLTASTNLLLSNHSYGAIAGWRFNEEEERWEYWGPAGSTQDYKFGVYNADTQFWDSIAYNAPNYLIVKSAGNTRELNGPPVGDPYFRFNANGQMASAGNRPAGISNNDSYDGISTYGTAKNVLTVGSIEPLVSGYTRPEDAIMTTFSSWGPTDDGRIKPDIVTTGVNVLSSIASSNTAYAYSTGTSMSTPGAAGSLLLLQEHYANLHGGAFIRSATLKGIAIHTADEIGADPGPDYQAGFGLLNMEKAASVITSNNTDQLIHENVLNNSATYSLPVVASGKGPLVVTICWTDPKGTPEAGTPLNSTLKKLVNDLDVRVKKGATTYMPWKLNPASPASAATKGDNVLDNIEKIEIPDAIPGEAFTIEVTHKGVLERGSQAYSLIVSGVGGTAYCASAPASTAGGRIDSVSFGTLQKLNPAGCTGYTNYTSLNANVETNATVPLFVKVSSCDVTTANKIVKAFIDFNNDGDFTDAGEQVAESPVINGSGTFTENVTIPANAVVGYYLMLRVIVQETSTPANVTPCGTYANGETQDYRLLISNASSDIGVTEILTPFDQDCAASNQYVTIRIKNYGASLKTNVPFSGTVKEGATTILNLTGIYPDTIPAYGEVFYSFQTPFTTQVGSTYTITARSDLGGDQKTTNDETTTSISISGVATTPTGEAEICGTEVLFKSTVTSPDVVFWYDSPTATTPIATGSTASSNVITGDKTYYIAKNDRTLKIGPANKLAFANGSYNIFNGNYVRFNIDVPLILESAKLFIGTSGKITFTVYKIISYLPNGQPENGQGVSQVTLDVYTTAPNPPPVLNTQNNDPADTGAVYYLGLPIPTTGDHVIVIDCQEGASIYRNTGIGASPYPFTIPGVISITGNSADPFGAFYYFFYDVSVRLAGCASARTSVVASTATAPAITLAGNTLTSSKNSGNQWYRDGSLIAGANNKTYIANTSGTYKVTTTDDFGCALTSNEINVTVTAIPNIDPDEINLKVLPNPNDGRFGLEFTVRTRADLQISMTNMLGQQVFLNNYPGFAGRFTKQMELGKLPSGVYMLKVQHDRKNYMKKIIIR